MVFLGLKKAQVAEQAEEIKVYRDRSSLQVDAKNKKSFLLIPYDPLRAWNRVIHQLDRMNLEISSLNNFGAFENTGLIGVVTDYEQEAEGGLYSHFSAMKKKSSRRKSFSKSVKRPIVSPGSKFRLKMVHRITRLKVWSFLEMLHQHLK